MQAKVLFKCMFFCVLTCLIAEPAFAQQDTPPVLHCAALQADGTVLLTWTPPAPVDPSTVYTIYRDTGSGFVLINTVGPSVATSYLDGLVNASGGPVSYYVVTSYLSQSPPSNTVSTLFLNLNALSQSSIASLTWNNPFNGSFAGQFIVERRVSPGNWTTIATLSNSTFEYKDTLNGFCVAQNEPLLLVDYRIQSVLPECNSLSQVASDEFQDLLGPLPPEVETVLINPITGDAEIYWFPSEAPDLEKYVVQSIIQEPGGTVSINVGSVANNLPTLFIYEQASINASSNLVVIAFDSCGNDNSYLGIFTTVFLKAIYTSCGQTATLSWNPYTGWDEGVDKYRIHAQIDGAPAVVIAEPTNQQNTIDIEVFPNAEYCFYIEAISNGTQRASTSNSTCITTDYPNVVDYAYLNSVSVTDNNTIEVNLLQDVDGIGTTYELWRSRGTSPFQLITTLMQTTNSTLSFIDIDVNPMESVYNYKWKVYDGCGEELFETNLGRNILLNAGPAGDAAVNMLDWTAYLIWEEGVEKYEIYRRLGADGPFEPFAELGPLGFSFSDNVDEFIYDEGYFCYKIVATENENSFGLSSKAESNVACVSLPPLMWIPNAIVVDGYNPVFKPVAGFIDFDSYAMEVRNKWGELLFESQNIDDGWDGTYKGQDVREDLYQYIISYRDGGGKLFIQQGIVTVLHESN